VLNWARKFFKVKKSNWMEIMTERKKVEKGEIQMEKDPVSELALSI